MSDVAAAPKVSVTPSPQATVIPETVVVLETENVTVTTWPVFAGLGVGLLTVTIGACAVPMIVTEYVTLWV